MASLSRKIFITLIVLFLLTFFKASGVIFSVLYLSPETIFDHLQLWRLFSYPFVPHPLDFLVGIVAFSIPGDEIESLMTTRRFGMVLLAIILGVAGLHLLVFSGMPMVPLAGSQNLALFVLVGYLYIFPKSSLRLLFFSIPTVAVVSFLLLVVIANGIYDWTQGSHPMLEFEHGLLGAIVGAVYFHVRYQKYALFVGPLRALERLTGRDRGAPQGNLSVVPSRRGVASPSTRSRTAFQKQTAGEQSDEERLNAILEKISEKSYSSLSDDEKNFLRNYSDRM